jgi:predicted XRE-type DNA-binding protein
MNSNPHLGSTLDDLLEAEGTLAQTNALALKRVIAWQVAQAMKEKGLSITTMAKAMGTSRASVNRLLNPEYPSLTLDTLERAAKVVNKQIKLELVDLT